MTEQLLGHKLLLGEIKCYIVRISKNNVKSALIDLLAGNEILEAWSLGKAHKRYEVAHCARPPLVIQTVQTVGKLFVHVGLGRLHRLIHQLVRYDGAVNVLHTQPKFVHCIARQILGAAHIFTRVRQTHLSDCQVAVRVKINPEISGDPMPVSLRPK